jgi:hypothetical protein
MTDTQPDRPADLRARRRAQPAADERIDPIDYRRDAEPVASPVSTSGIPTMGGHEAQAQTDSETPSVSGNTRREVTIPISTRLAPDVLELIDRAVAEGKDGGVGPQTQRAVVEKAIRDVYKRRNGTDEAGV